MEDALRLSAAMTRKCAVAGLPNGGGKTVVALPPNTTLSATDRAEALKDVGDVIEALNGRYATGPDVGTSPADMVVIGERTAHVCCRPPEHGGSGDSSPHTADGVMAAIRAVCVKRFGSPELAGRRLAICGLGSVGGRLARRLAAAGASLVVSDIDPARKDLATELDASWAEPEAILTQSADILVPAALGGAITDALVPELHCAAIVGPANNQLASPDVADLLKNRGITWVPDYVASAGGVSYALSVELLREGPGIAHDRVVNIEQTVSKILETADRDGITPANAAQALATERLRR
jgi:leucine dehydrogenase